jgi:tRNA(fMet)-specific endonuclease VapC
MSVLERGGTESVALRARLAGLSPEEVATCIVCYEEQARGWLAHTARAHRSAAAEIEAYRLLAANLRVYCDVTVLQYGANARAQFEQLQQAKVRIGTQDLKIAAIALSNGAVLLSRNLRDFGKVPGLTVEDWTVPLP